MAWKLTIGDRSCLLDDLPPAVFQQVGTRHELTWLELYTSPARNPDAYLDLVDRAADHLEVARPERPATMRGMLAALEWIEQVDDDLPQEYEDGLPSPEAGQTTGGLSGRQSDSDGLPTSPSDSLSDFSSS